MKLYNTLTRKKEEFIPLDNEQIRMYSCGPTVYKESHIGNFRTAIMENTLENILKYNGYKVKHVMNITDVGHLVSDADEGEDKMEKSAREEHKKPSEIAKYYTKIYFDGFESLNLSKPDIICPATDYIDEMIEFVKILIEKDYAYVTENAVYFDISKLEKYPNLTNQNLEDQKDGVRISNDKSKRNPQDFALWIKADDNHLQKWDNPWYDKGFPGWHIECSTMSNFHLGKQFDIHTGGVDLIPTHHENEIAQSIGANGVIPARYWVHSEYILIDNKKMSKSLGNVYYIKDFINKGYNPLAYKYFVYSGSYRSKINFTLDILESANIALNKIYRAYLENLSLDANDDAQKDLDELEQKFKLAINDDMNMPKAISHVWEVIKYPNKCKNISLMLEKLDEVLRLDIKNADKYVELKKNENNYLEIDKLPDNIQKLILERKMARENKNWQLSDDLRDELNSLGYKVIDKQEGMFVEKLIV